MLTVAIQAGGESRRMGQYKALMPFLGRPLIQRIVERLSPIADELLVTTNRPQDLRFLNLPLYQDIKPGRGALGGLYTALSSASYGAAAVVACDMPFASGVLLDESYRLLIQDEADVVIPESNKGLEPMHAVYRRETCLPAIKSAIEADKWRLISWFSEVNVRIFQLKEIKFYDDTRLAFWNLNTPEDFSEAEQYVLRGDSK